MTDKMEELSLVKCAWGKATKLVVPVIAGVAGGRYYQGKQDQARVKRTISDIGNRLPEYFKNLSVKDRTRLSLGLTFKPEAVGESLNGMIQRTLKNN